MREDLEQELLVILHNESRNFDPAKSSFSTFAKRVLANRSQNHIRNVLTAARHNGEYGIENISIYERVGSDGKIVGDFINFDEVRIQMGYQSRSECEMKELRECIDLALSRLPVASREICLAILRGETVSSLAKAHGMDVSWFRAKYLSSLRPIFIDAEINGF
jgi:RNA polymerase sigma factor (sigma-70 family)